MPRDLGVSGRPTRALNRVPMDEQEVELSVVMPCLDEADTLVVCIHKAQEGLRASGCQGEIVVADNGSTDGSPQLAEREGARVVLVRRRGYGAALMGGIASARGRFVLMADADDSYDLREIPRFLERLRGGAELVQGCRLPSGGGTIRPGAMPWLAPNPGKPDVDVDLAPVFPRACT